MNHRRCPASSRPAGTGSKRPRARSRTIERCPTLGTLTSSFAPGAASGFAARSPSNGILEVLEHVREDQRVEAFPARRPAAAGPPADRPPRRGRSESAPGRPARDRARRPSPSSPGFARERRRCRRRRRSPRPGSARRRRAAGASARAARARRARRNGARERPGPRPASRRRPAAAAREAPPRFRPGPRESPPSRKPARPPRRAAAGHLLQRRALELPQGVDVDRRRRDRVARDQHAAERRLRNAVAGDRQRGRVAHHDPGFGALQRRRRRLPRCPVRDPLGARRPPPAQAREARAVVEGLPRAEKRDGSGQGEAAARPVAETGRSASSSGKLH